MAASCGRWPLHPASAASQEHFSSLVLTFAGSRSPLDGFCQQLVDTMEGTPQLRFVWSAVRPLVQGKVLYTPDTPAARRLVTQVRSGWDSSSAYRGKYPHLAQPWGCWGRGLGCWGRGLHGWV